MISAEDWKEEQKRLDLVHAKLQERITELEPEVAGLHDQVSALRRQFWEEVTVNTSTDEDFEETFYSIRQQEALLSERERSQRLRLQQWKSMKRLQLSPYFGRIDFHEDGLKGTESVYIGVSSFADADGIEFLVYDWRTPIASMYYDHSPGPARYDTPGGTITGTMKLKRQYQISGRELQSVFDTSVTIGDELLQQVLGKGSDHQMKSIVATIQKEQNAIIRDNDSRMLIVQGAAGSGKTSAALQRVAYLLYKYRDQLRADQIVLFSPNPMFNSYVSTVLPELGEENMQQTTFQEYLEYWLAGSFSLEDPFDQIEYLLTGYGDPEYAARLHGIQYKASDKFLEAVRHYVQWLERQGMQFNSISLGDRELIPAKQIEEKFYSYDSSIRMTNRITLLQEWLLRELSLLERGERRAVWVQEELDYLDKEHYAAAFSKLHKDRGVFDFAEQYEEVREMLESKRRPDESDFDYAEREEEELRRMIVKERFKPLKRYVKRMRFIDMTRLYVQLFDHGDAYQKMTKAVEVPPSWLEICNQTKGKLGRGELFYEDATPYLYLKEQVEGVRTNTEIRHVFIDEGQDYSLFQFQYLRNIFPRARMTVLGDFSQAIFAQATELYGEQSPLTQLYGETETSLYRLNRSYRSTREIIEFTKYLLPNAKEIVPFERSGRRPILKRVSNDAERTHQIMDDISALQAEGFSSIGILTKTAAEGREAYDLLSSQSNQSLRLVTKNTLTFETGTLVIPVYLAKGVEFDAVLIYDASSQTYERENERKLFYTACTRAMHRLVLYATGEWTPFIRDMDTALYEVESQI